MDTELLRVAAVLVASAVAVSCGSGGSEPAGGAGGAAGVPVDSGSAGADGTTSGTGPGGGDDAGTPGVSSTLPALSVSGNKLIDPTGKTIVLRGTSLIDIGALYAYHGNSASGITARIDAVVAAGLAGHAVRFPVCPKISYNGSYPYCSPVPYPVGTGPATSCTPAAPMSASDYVDKVLRPAVDYATSKNMYAIIDYHQVDDATKGTSAADATTFWTDIAPKFAAYTNVIYEAFNEPIDTSASWATLKPVVQGWIDVIRAGAPDNVIIVPSMLWDQRTGDAASNPPNGKNLMYTAHIYPTNWNTTFRAQVATAVAKAPLFVTEWGYTYSTTQTGPSYTSSPTWGADLRTVLDGNGASWTAWVTDNGWMPPMFSDASLTALTDFGMFVQGWLAATAASDWVE